MKQTLTVLAAAFSPCLFSLCLFSLSPIVGSSESFVTNPMERNEEFGEVYVLPNSKNRIIELNDKGVSPAQLHLKKKEGVVFFLNNSTDDLATIEIDLSGNSVHCSSSNLEVTKSGKLRSVQPFGPKNFATLCFPQKGAYALKVYGLKPNPDGIAAQIVVED